MNNIKNKIIGSAFSKTVWFSFILMGVNWLNNNGDSVTSLFPKEYNELVLYGVGGLVLLLRWITTKPVSEKTPVKLQTEEEKKVRVNKAEVALKDALAANLDDF